MRDLRRTIWRWTWVVLIAVTLLGFLWLRLGAVKNGVDAVRPLDGAAMVRGTGRARGSATGPCLVKPKVAFARARPRREACSLLNAKES